MNTFNGNGMNDRELIQKLIERDNRVTEEFFFVRCRPLFLSVIRQVFPYDVDYAEFVNELYVYLMENDAARLRSFQFRSSVYQWLKVLSIRYFIQKRDRMVDDTSRDEVDENAAAVTEPVSRNDLYRLIAAMPNRRYAAVILRLVVDGVDPQKLALEMGTTTSNIYNIKRRAMAQLTEIALQDIRYYEK